MCGRYARIQVLASIPDRRTAPNTDHRTLIIEIAYDPQNLDSGPQNAKAQPQWPAKCKKNYEFWLAPWLGSNQGLRINDQSQSTSSFRVPPTT
ncbi:protein of unknown function [Georgfuchsia toluolica]|uniref:Uncharacterized protein n=1 Tax=Georgfuchsia toluolica TaxID=424218 RepID=A0A916J6U2_9PROT|nr:protein of unknown function [Georgfuchsia toluolica]